MARHRDPPRVEAQQRGEDAERRRLAGAVGTEEPDDLARGDLERDAAERELRAVTFPKAVD